MNGAELGRAAARLANVPESTAHAVIRKTIDAALDTLRSGGSVTLPGLGVIKVAQIKRTEFVNPRAKGGKVQATGPRFKLSFKMAKTVFDNPPGAVIAPPAAPVFAVGVQAFQHVEVQDMSVFVPVNLGVIRATTAAANAIVLGSVPMAAADQFQRVRAEVLGTRKQSAWLGQCWLRFELWVTVAGVQHEQAAATVRIGAAHNCGVYYWSMKASYQASGGACALLLDVDWWDDDTTQAQRVNQSLVWSVRPDAVEFRMRYVGQDFAALEPLSNADAHWSEVLQGSIEALRVQ